MPLPRFLAHNLSWKAIAVILATLVWMTLKSAAPARPNPTASLTLRRLPITVMTAATDDHVFRVEPATVDVTVSGPSELLRRLHTEEVHVFVDLTSVTAARELRKKVEAYVPPPLTVSSVAPTEVLIHSGPPPAPAPARKP